MKYFYMRVYFQFIIIFILSVSSSCSNTAQTTGSVSPDEFEKAIQQKNVQILDTRTAGEFQSGHISGALQADWTDEKQFIDRTSHLDKNRPVYVYCLSGARSSDAAEYLREQGFKEVVNMQGGISAWRRSGKKLEATDVSQPQMSQAAYDETTRSNDIVLVDFGAQWCPPCKKMEPVIAAFMNEQGNNVKLVKMDGGNEIELMKTLKVDALPTFILYRKGQETVRKQGIMTKEELTAWVK
jgi:thioredoxin